MNIHIVTIAYGLAQDTLNLFRMAYSQRHTITWHLFLHSQFPDVVQACDYIARHDDVRYYPCGTNRGLARSWNDGIIAAYSEGADVVIIANDDMRPDEHDVDRLAEYAADHREYFVVTCDGFDLRQQAHLSMSFGFFAYNPLALQRLGCFDENFFPIYFEDVDYSYRAHLAGLVFGHCAGTHLIHQGSKSIHAVPNLAGQNTRTYEANHLYYQRKWGGELRGGEHHPTPFNAPQFGVYIAPENRAAPYPGFNRQDQALVQF